jgi:hypothetical protein
MGALLLLDFPQKVALLENPVWKPSGDRFSIIKNNLPSRERLNWGELTKASTDFPAPGE